jgi:preprotein translocase subunit SecE
VQILTAMNSITNYIKESYNELRHKVTWPTLKELQGSSVLVLITSLIIALIVYGMDAGFGQILGFIYETIY